jgi:hypothetical protein
VSSVWFTLHSFARFCILPSYRNCGFLAILVKVTPAALGLTATSERLFYRDGVRVLLAFDQDSGQDTHP